MPSTVSERSENLPSEAILAAYDTFLATASIDRFQKILARYELFRMIMDVPGDIVECGVYKGSGIYTLAKLQRLFKPHNTYQRIIGFDFFEATRAASFTHAEDKRCLDLHGEDWSPREAILRNLAQQHITNVELVPGNVVDTTGEYVRTHLGFRIALLYLDVDNYEGTLACLRNLYPMISVGGLVAFDEYACRTYGESDAVDEYFKGQDVQIKSLPWANTPTGYVRKTRV
jgi:hypothetical protein